MAKKILVVGIHGFVGHHLADELSSNNIEVVGLGLVDKLSAELSKKVVKYIKCDLTDMEQVDKMDLSDIDGVINLAALAVPSQSFSNEELYYKVNVKAHTNLIEKLIKDKRKIRVLSISSGAVYDSNQPMPLTESSKLITSGNPYAMSKKKMEEELAKFDYDGLEVIVVRPFNHTGPGQELGFILPDLTHKILHDDDLTVGPLNTSRDYTHVRDVARAYRMLLSHDKKLKHSTYNVCSGKATSRDELIEIIKKTVGRNDIEINIDPNIGRPSDPEVLYGSYERINQEIGWQPTKNVEDIVKDYVKWLG